MSNYQIIDAKNRKKLREILSSKGQALLPFLDAIERTEIAIDEARHVSRHRHLADNESELRQLSVDTRCTPAVLGHRADETTNLGINPRSTWIARTGDSSPVSAEPTSIPPGDRVGVHDNEPARPRWPRASERNPECSVRVLERWPGALLLQRRNLLPQGQVFNHEVGSAPTHRPDRTGAK